MWQFGKEQAQFIQGVAPVGVKLQQVSALLAGVVQVDEPRQAENTSSVPDVVSAYCNTQPLVKVSHPVDVDGGLLEQVARLYLAKAGFDHPGEGWQIWWGKGYPVQPQSSGQVDGVTTVSL